MKTLEVIMRRAARSMLVLPLLILAVTACGVANTSAPPPPRTSSPGTPTASVSPPSASPSPLRTSRTLTPGMSGTDVRQLQRQLASLHYDPGPADGRFGPDTQEAVWAFQAVQGIAVTGNVGPVTRQALAHPRDPAALVPDGGNLRIEINLARAVLVLYRAGQVALISHVSTGGGYYYCSPAGGCSYAVTPTGDFATTAFMPGWVTVPLGQMYNPVFFIGTAYAIHGAPSVPLQPASHGCVRIPMHIAEFFYRLVPVPGTPVYIRHG